ncbi:stage II sporulation protein R [Mesobacillus selenatarsenatis]|uniref:Stage II sporulation protein R n=1 Tax=Mesobacillus selenatarsenatis TaxID=388741 RepID=A0A846TGN5_9BACI|nr:stage II sporulation protein R [Mesobacillus selenatarsenatis]NKE04582.1 stage II sporulation protein R [Mesobacillus selenatarsenatis]
MKKSAAILYILLLCAGTILSLYTPKNEVTAKEAMVIPNEAIRLRILADSDLEKDQNIKRLIRDEVNKEITKWVQELTSIEAAREVIKSKLPEIQVIAEGVIAAEGANQSVKTEFDKVQFPTKLYGQFLYPAGEYEAILITIGEGEGANWWCVLYPPLCFLDFSNGEATSEGFDENDSKGDVKVETADAELDDEKNDGEKEKKKDKKKVYEGGEEEEVEVSFFLVEIWNRIFG